MSAAIKPVTKQNTQSLFQKLIEVMEEIGRIEKRGYNSFHKYAYVKEDDLVEAVRGKLSERGILLLPSLNTVQREGTLTTAVMSFTFVDSVTGEKQEASWAGTGDDKGDKGLYKAYTGAEKYFLMKTFLIPTGDDPEGDEKTDKRAEKAQAKPKAAPRDDAEDVALVDGVAQAFKLLNQAGDVPPWTPRLMNEYAVKYYGAPVMDLEVQPLRDLIKKLSMRLDEVRSEGRTRMGEIDDEPASDPQKCNCGIARVRVEGITKQGKNKGHPWAAWMCANKAEGCDPLWIDLNAEAEDDANSGEF